MSSTLKNILWTICEECTTVWADFTLTGCKNFFIMDWNISAYKVQGISNSKVADLRWVFKYFKLVRSNGTHNKIVCFEQHTPQGCASHFNCRAVKWFLNYLEKMLVKWFWCLQQYFLSYFKRPICFGNLMVL